MEGSKVRIRVSREVVHGGGGSTGVVSGVKASTVILRSNSALRFSIGNISRVLRPPLMTFPCGRACVCGWVCSGALAPPLL
jgi:hypothetical protein